MPVIRIPGLGREWNVEPGVNLLEALKQAEIYPDAPCGGNGTCGKCTVTVNGAEAGACRTVVDRDLTVELPEGTAHQILLEGACGTQRPDPLREGYLLAFDLGTTSVVCWLLDGKTGAELAGSSALNPQIAFGADVISRVRAALGGAFERQTALIRETAAALTRAVCAEAGVSAREIGVVSVVGNPAMQQLFLGISPENLARVPFAPVLTEEAAVPAGEYLPDCPNARLLIVPDISGVVGADTVGCLLASQLYKRKELTLLVDIGTNGEMVLGNRERMIACAAAAGPALEGAGIRFGMRAAEGAIDHVWLEKGEVKCSVIGGGEAKGICGSGLVDAVAVGLRLGLINRRGRIRNEERCLPLADGVFLTQEDIRQVQLAKGAVCAGIALMARAMGVRVGDIQRVQLAGAFGSFLDPENACRIGLLPETLPDQIETLGNAAGSGAKMLACDPRLLPLARELAGKTEFLELASLPEFPRAFAGAMCFREEDPVGRWQEKAKAMGFDEAAAIDPQTLTAREDVRAMCAADKCGAYGKNWTCPPAIGTVRECQDRMRQYRMGLLLQTVGHMRKTIDSGCLRETERRHMQNLQAFAREIRSEYPGALCLGAGGCRVCPVCSYPGDCRFPERALSSMEGYGLFVTQVCRDAGVPYHHGEKTVAFTACVLFG